MVEKIEIPIAKRAIEMVGLYIVQKSNFERLADIASDACRDHPFHNWFTKGKYDEEVSKLIMQFFKTMAEDAFGTGFLR